MRGNNKFTYQGEALIMGSYKDNGMKGEERNFRYAIVRNHNRFPGGSQEPNTVKFTDVKEGVMNRVHDAFRGTGWYVEIYCHRCGQVANSNRGRGRERKCVTKKRITIIALRYGLALIPDRMIVRIKYLYPTAVS